MHTMPLLLRLFSRPPKPGASRMHTPEPTPDPTVPGPRPPPPPAGPDGLPPKIDDPTPLDKPVPVREPHATPPPAVAAA